MSKTTSFLFYNGGTVSAQIDKLSTDVPLRYPNCGLWLDASDVNSIVKDGSNIVSTWNDKSGKGRHATQSNATYKPIWSSNQITFDGKDDHLVIGNINFLSNRNRATIFVVATGSGIQTGNAGIGYILSKNQFEGGTPINIGCNTASGTSWRPYITISGTANTGEWDTFELFGVKGKAVFRLENGYTTAKAGGLSEEASYATVAVTNTTNSANVCIGSHDSIATYRPFNGKIHEMIVYERYLSTEEVDAVYSYLGTKWLAL